MTPKKAVAKIATGPKRGVGELDPPGGANPLVDAKRAAMLQQLEARVVDAQDAAVVRHTARVKLVGFELLAVDGSLSHAHTDRRLVSTRILILIHSAMIFYG